MRDQISNVKKVKKKRNVVEKRERKCEVAKEMGFVVSKLSISTARSHSWDGYGLWDVNLTSLIARGGGGTCV